MGQINDLTKVIHEAAVDKGWWVLDRPPLEIHSLIHSEIAEATEDVRRSSPPVYFEGEKPCGEAVELADAVIRIMDYFGRNRWDMEQIIEQKLAYNKTRAYRHGGKLY